MGALLPYLMAVVYKRRTQISVNCWRRRCGHRRRRVYDGGRNVLIRCWRGRCQSIGSLSQTIEGGFGSFGTAYKPPEVPEFDQRVTFRNEPSLKNKTISAETNVDLPETDLVKTASEMPVKMPEGPGTDTSNMADVFQKGGKGPMEALGDAFFPKGPTTAEVLKLNPRECLLLMLLL